MRNMEYSFINLYFEKKLKLIEQYKDKDPSLEIKFDNKHQLIVKSKDTAEIVINDYDDYIFEYLLYMMNNSMK